MIININLWGNYVIKFHKILKFPNCMGFYVKIIILWFFIKMQKNQWESCIFARWWKCWYFIRFSIGFGGGFWWKSTFSLKWTFALKSIILRKSALFALFWAASDLFRKRAKLPSENVVLEQHFQPWAEMERKSVNFHNFPSFY